MVHLLASAIGEKMERLHIGSVAGAIATDLLTSEVKKEAGQRLDALSRIDLTSWHQGYQRALKHLDIDGWMVNALDANGAPRRIADMASQPAWAEMLRLDDVQPLWGHSLLSWSDETEKIDAWTAVYKPVVDRIAADGWDYRSCMRHVQRHLRSAAREIGKDRRMRRLLYRGAAEGLARLAAQMFKPGSGKISAWRLDAIMKEIADNVTRQHLDTMAGSGAIGILHQAWYGLLQFCAEVVEGRLFQIELARDRQHRRSSTMGAVTGALLGLALGNFSFKSYV